MRPSVQISLASEPFRSDRPFHLAALAATILLSGLLVVQVLFGLIERDLRVQLSLDIDKTSQQLRTIAAEQAKLDETLRQPANSEALDYAVFLNGALLRKGISWTQIFSDLDQVMPHDVRLIQVRPQVNLDNQILLDMYVGAQTPEPVIGMLMKLEGSPLFGATTLNNWLPPSQSDPLFRYRVSVNYAPKL